MTRDENLSSHNSVVVRDCAPVGLGETVLENNAPVEVQSPRVAHLKTKQNQTSQVTRHASVERQGSGNTEILIAKTLDHQRLIMPET